MKRKPPQDPREVEVQVVTNAIGYSLIADQVDGEPPEITVTEEDAERFRRAADRAIEHLDFHRRKSRPEVVVLCGSTRFYDEFQRANYELTMAGKIVLSVGFYPHASKDAGHGEGVGHDSEEKVQLDELHKRKIDLADRVYVLNVGGYVGDSTRSEIEYAEAVGRPIDYMESV